MPLPPVRQLIIESLTLPRAAARRVLSVDLSYGDALIAAAAVLIVGTLLGALTQFLVPGDLDTMSAAIVSQPLVLALVQIMLVVAIAGFATEIGRRFGGHGTHAQALRLIVWLQFVMLVIQLVQLILLLALPVLAALLMIFAFGWFIYALCAFIAELHGFESLLKVLVGVFISFIAVVFVLSILLAIIGVDLTSMGPPDV